MKNRRFVKQITAMSISLLCCSFSPLGFALDKPIDGEQLFKEVIARVPNINTDELVKQLKEKPETVVIDVRNEDEISLYGGMINARNSHNIARGWLEHFTPQTVTSVDTPIVVYCGTGQRSPFATETLLKMGYKDVKNYKDGFFKWRDAGLPVEVGDKAPESMLYSLPQQVTDNVWSAIGATQPPTYKNSGHNNNLSFVITSEGVVVINAGDNYLLAKALHEEIKKITDQPVKYVILENAQGHAALGSGYWKEQGAKIIAHVHALDALKLHGKGKLERMVAGRKDKSLGTELALPDITFEDKYVLELGGEVIEALYLGPAHSPGDISVWLPKQKLAISGDMAFHQRLLLISDHTDTAGWIESWANFEALEPEIIIPGHGSPTNLDEVRKYTHDYLVYMRSEVEKILDEGGELTEAYKIDQSAYSHLDTYKELARSNAGNIFRAMEFE